MTIQPSVFSASLIRIIQGAYQPYTHAWVPAQPRWTWFSKEDRSERKRLRWLVLPLSQPSGKNHEYWRPRFRHQSGTGDGTPGIALVLLYPTTSQNCVLQGIGGMATQTSWVSLGCLHTPWEERSINQFWFWDTEVNFKGDHKGSELCASPSSLRDICCTLSLSKLTKVRSAGTVINIFRCRNWHQSV